MNFQIAQFIVSNSMDKSNIRESQRVLFFQIDCKFFRSNPVDIEFGLLDHFDRFNRPFWSIRPEWSIKSVYCFRPIDRNGLIDRTQYQLGIFILSR